jgi:two-component system C4-dicarboxylate transport sensor histidine kinase DctB
VLDVNGLVSDVDKMLRRLIGDGIEFRTDLAPDLWHVKIDAGGLEQVLVNLVGNALDAMRDAEPRVLTLSAERCEVAGVPMVALTVRDSGKGLSETDQRRLFEPFYTTKPSGAGLGLGLAICRDLAAEFGGDLQAHNHADGGACFVLTVPVGPAPDTAKDTPSR